MFRKPETPAEPEDHPYKHWNRERLRAETDARGIDVRLDAEAHEYVNALLADDKAKADAENG